MIHNCTETPLTRNRKWEDFHHDEAKTSWAELAGSLSTSERKCLGRPINHNASWRTSRNVPSAMFHFILFSSLQKYLQLPALLVILWFCFMNSFSHFFLCISVNSVLGVANTLICQLKAFSLHFPFILYMLFIALHFLKDALGGWQLFLYSF